MNTKIEREINKLYSQVYKKVFNKEATNSLMNGSSVTVSQRLQLLASSVEYNEFAKKFSIELAKQGLSNEKGLWRKYFEAAKQRHYIALPTTFKEYEMQTLSKAVKTNFEMITSIPSRMMEILEHKYTSTLIEEVAKGNLPRGSFRKLLQSHGAKQAKVIARTETAKLQTAITENRAKNLGSVAYIWRSSNDQRTRPSHKAMNDVVVFWRDQSQKPLLDNMRGNAGEFPNCRCTIRPILNEDDLTKTTYKVYNYNTDTIDTMYKNELLNAIEDGEIK